jgi:hypothetical protein
MEVLKKNYILKGSYFEKQNLNMVYSSVKKRNNKEKTHDRLMGRPMVTFFGRGLARRNALQFGPANHRQAAVAFDQSLLRQRDMNDQSRRPWSKWAGSSSLPL